MVKFSKRLWVSVWCCFDLDFFSSEFYFLMTVRFYNPRTWLCIFVSENMLCPKIWIFSFTYLAGASLWKPCFNFFLKFGLYNFTLFNLIILSPSVLWNMMNCESSVLSLFELLWEFYHLRWHECIFCCLFSNAWLKPWILGKLN